MSADLYASEIDFYEFGDLDIKMNVHGHLFITVQDPEIKKHNERGHAYFNLPPCQEGRDEAKKIIQALQSWIERLEKDDESNG